MKRLVVSIITSVAIWASALSAMAQTEGLAMAEEQASEDISKLEMQYAGYYYNYPGVPAGYQYTAAPAGYEPFYISHYGRHGSRFLTSNKKYESVIALLTGHQLTDFGKDVLSRMQRCFDYSQGNDGALSLLGARQHRQIAARMYRQYQSLLSKPIHIEARSSTAMRCAISMANCCMELRALNPTLDITMQSAARFMPVLVNKEEVAEGECDSLRKEQFRQFTDSIVQPSRFLELLFTNYRDEAAGRQMMLDCWHIFADMQNLPELGISFRNLFTHDELFRLWQWDNAEDLYAYGILPGCSRRYHRNARRIVEDIVSQADSVIQTGKPAVALRFGHDTNLASLAYLLQLSGCNGTPQNYRDAWKHWANYQVTPMAANLQVVFYRKNGVCSADDVLVKFVYNETERTIPLATDSAPYYRWSEVRRWMASLSR
ncbi:MAG: hypothetical protein IJ562_09350 [Prevotella sp.]|nr:hypothetical protein [Prevotella sp.]